MLGATGLDNRTVYIERGTAHRLGVKLAAESIAVGRAQGFELGTVLGIAPDDWHAALTALVKRIDAGELKPDPQNIEGLKI